MRQSPIHQLQSPLNPEECLARLREQVQPLRWWSRMNLFRCRTSRVLGRLAGSAIVLESSSDVYSKRFVGTLRATPGGTCIDYFWKKGAGHCVYGDGAFDEEEILSFLAEWLEAQQLESPG